MQHLLDMVFGHRAKPITEQGVPAERVEINNQWEMHVVKITADTAFAVYRLDRKYSFNIQVNLCELDGSPIVPEGTLLGGGETPSTFYEGNYSFYVRDTVEFNRCVDQAGIRFEADPVSSKGDTLYHSHDRVLRQMCNWLRFLAMDESDPGRAADFMAFILGKQREVLLHIDAAQDSRLLAHEIGLFDRMFPFALFDANLSSSGEVRDQGRAYLQATLLLRRKLKGVGQNQVEQIARDEGLLRRLAK